MHQSAEFAMIHSELDVIATVIFPPLLSMLRKMFCEISSFISSIFSE